MLYFQFEYHCKGMPPATNREEQMEMQGDILKRSKYLNHRLGKKAQFFVIKTNEEEFTMCASLEVEHSNELRSLADSFFLGLGLKGKHKESTEITIAQFLVFLSTACHNSYVANDDEVKKELGLDCFGGFRSLELEESLINSTFSKRQAIIQCRKLLCVESMSPELERIFTQSTSHGFRGHPVHYAIVSDDIEVRRAIRELLLGSLVKVKRLQSRRICFLPSKQDLVGRHKLDLAASEATYQVQKGGTTVVRSTGSDTVGDAFSIKEIKELSALIRAHRRNVLTIIEFEKSDSTLLKKWMKSLHDIPFIYLEEETVLKKTAISHLKCKAKADGIIDGESIATCLPSHRKGFIFSELSQIYDQWYDGYLRTVVYSQYNNISSCPQNTDAIPQGEAFAELENMIGLSDVKTIVRQLIDFNNTRKLVEKHGVSSSQATMHMVFSGSPGTAKTTVARLLAKIMKDNGLLSVGELVEVGRADIIDRYVGGTAPKVRALFKQAKGSVIFIDEAYSLMDDRSGLYGDEAISTIVQEMENARNDTAVIFAGYPEKMNDFLESNPGLRSRIAFHVPFSDYNAEELAAILNLIAKQECMHIEPSAQLKINCILSEAMEYEDFGNGRFARNMFEQAKMKQASRLMACGDEKRLSSETLLTLTSEDFTKPTEFIKKQAMQKIGF